MRYFITLLAVVTASLTANGQREAYIKLIDRDSCSKDNENGIVLQGFYTERYHTFMFNPAQPRVYFMPLDQRKSTPDTFILTDSMIGDDTHLVIQYFNARNQTRCLPEVVQPKDIASLPAFMLSDGDMIVIELRRNPDTTSR